MSRWPRRVGYGLMAAALLLAAGWRSGLIEAFGPFPVVAVALLVGMIGVMLVFTDLMVQGLYAQVDAEGRSERQNDD